MYMITCFSVTFVICENRNSSIVVEYSMKSWCDDSCVDEGLSLPGIGADLKLFFS